MAGSNLKGFTKPSSRLRFTRIVSVTMIVVLSIIAPPKVGASASSCGTELCVVTSGCGILTGNPAVIVTYHSNQTGAVAAVAVADVQDFLGYVVASVSSPFSIGPNGNATVQLQLGNIPQGNYNITVYAYNPTFSVVLSGAFPINCTFGSSADVLPTGTRTLTLVRPLSHCPGVCPVGLPFVNATYKNNLGFSLTAIATMVVRNSLGEVVYFTTSTLVIKAGENSTAYLVVSGLPHGFYTATAFALAPRFQYVLSESSSLNFTL